MRILQGSKDIYADCIGLGALHAAWERVRRNRGASGGDGVTIGAFAQDAPLRLARLHRALMCGAYRPGPARRLNIPKPSGGQRALAIPAIEDRIAQSAVALTLGPRLEGEFEESSFAYRPGRSVRMAVDRISANRRAGFEWVVDGDIERFFDSVPHDLVLKRLAQSISSDRLIELVALWLRAHDDDGVGLPQGSPLSPLLANLYLDDIDEQIESDGVRLIRFADDFILMCKKERSAEAALKRMEGLLQRYGLRLNPEKTRIISFDEGFRFLGHLFVRSVVLPSKEEEVLSEEDEPGDALNDTEIDDENTELVDAPWAIVEKSEDEATRSDLSPRLRVLYLKSPHRSLARRDWAFTIIEDDREVLAIHHKQVDRIEVGPDCDVDTDAIRLGLLTETPVAFVDGHGTLIGEAAPPEDNRPRLHLAQSAVIHDGEARRSLAAAIVDGRLYNQRALLYRLNRRRKDDEVKRTAKTIGRLRQKLKCGLDIDQLFGLEGEATRLYWPALGRCFEHGWTLTRRRRRPPPDPVNLIISWLASLLYRDLNALIRRHGLHPGFGVLHGHRPAQPALASDLIEAFRAPLVEGLAVYLFNNRILDRDHFSQNEDGSVRINAVGGEQVIREYEAWLDRPIQVPQTDQDVLWRGMMEEQIVAYRQAVLDGKAFLPYQLKY